MKVAVVHDWLAGFTGAERVLSALLELYPYADVYTLFDFLRGEERKFLGNHRVFTSVLQGLPLSRKIYRSLLLLMPLAIEMFNFKDYNLVISSSSSVAKGVITGPDTLHISYMHSPPRYIWDLQDSYLHKMGRFKRLLTSSIFHLVRVWDYSAGQRPDFIISNSNFVRGRIKKYYRRDSTVIYPPVDISDFKIGFEKSDFYVTVSRLVPYKRVDLLIDAFNQNGKKLYIIGSGPDFKKLSQKIRNKNIMMMGYQTRQIIREFLQKARGYVFAGEEDFGIAMVEAMAAGTPVIAYYKGGAGEIVEDKKTGILFFEQNASQILKSIEKFESIRFDPCRVRERAENFGKQIFQTQFKEYVDLCMNNFHSRSEAPIE